MGRIETAFAKAAEQKRGTLGVFVTAGDPDMETSARILDAVAEAGADIIEFGMPFSDPMADLMGMLRTQMFIVMGLVDAVPMIAVGISMYILFAVA